VDALKIDRSFLTDSGRPRAAALLRCVIDFAHALSLRVVAEGVETQIQMDLLALLGCDEVRGFFLGEPSFEITDVNRYAKCRPDTMW
jgi:EAL domain-containing protein (putative c-di-GMP-specific phosphodiesterase class I)